MTDGAGLGDEYGTTVERVQAQSGDKSGLVMADLMRVCHSEQLFEADELRHTLAIEIGSTNLNISNSPSMFALVDYCQKTHHRAQTSPDRLANPPYAPRAFLYSSQYSSVDPAGQLGKLV